MQHKYRISFLVFGNTFITHIIISRVLTKKKMQMLEAMSHGYITS